MKAEQHRNQSSQASDKLASTFPFYGIDEQRSLERTPVPSHEQSEVEAFAKRRTTHYSSDIPENFPAKDGDRTTIDDSLNMSLVKCRSLGHAKRGTKNHFPVSPLKQKVLDLALTKSPLKIASPILPSRSRRSQLSTSVDATASSDFKIASPYVHLRNETAIEHITSSKKKSARLRRGLFLGFSSCCKNNTSSSTNLKLKGRSKSCGKNTKSLPASNESWKKERAWNVIANVDNHTIKKKVVLKKSLTAETHNAPKFVETSSSIAASDGSSTCQVEPNVNLPTVSCTLASAGCNYRLSTSSADASLEVDAFVWDKEHSSFTSEDTTLTFFELSKPVRSGHLPRDETLTRESSIVVSSCDEEPTIATSAASQRQIPASAFSSNFSNSDIVAHSVSKANSQLCSYSKHVYGDSKIYDSAKQEECPSILDYHPRTRVDLKTVAEEVPGAEGKGAKPSTSQAEKNYEAPFENLSSNVQSLQRKVRESVAVVVVSNNLYHDFQQSMLEMVIGKKLRKTGELEELLQYYLSLNPPCFHDVIVEVFTDLWLQLLHIS